MSESRWRLGLHRRLLKKLTVLPDPQLDSKLMIPKKQVKSGYQGKIRKGKGTGKTGKSLGKEKWRT